MDGHSGVWAPAAQPARLGGRRHALSTAPGEPVPVPAEALRLFPGLLSATLPPPRAFAHVACSARPGWRDPGRSLQPASCSLLVAMCMPPLRSLRDSPSSGKAPALDSPVPTCVPSECPPPPGKANHGVWAGGRTSPVYSPLPLPLGIAGTGVPERMRPGLWIMVLLLPPNPRTPHAAQPQPFPGSAGQSASVACGFFWNHHTDTPFPWIPRHQVDQRGCDE